MACIKLDSHRTTCTRTPAIASVWCVWSIGRLPISEGIERKGKRERVEVCVWGGNVKQVYCTRWLILVARDERAYSKHSILFLRPGLCVAPLALSAKRTLHEPVQLRSVEPAQLRSVFRAPPRRHATCCAGLHIKYSRSPRDFWWAGAETSCSQSFGPES